MIPCWEVSASPLLGSRVLSHEAAILGECALFLPDNESATVSGRRARDWIFLLTDRGNLPRITLACSVGIELDCRLVTIHTFYFR